MLERIHFPDADGRADEFPFNIPALEGLEALEVATPVTLLVGENGSGKSTVLEALAAATGLPTVGSRSADRDPTLAPQRRLAKTLRLAWSKRTHRGFFLRAEDSFGFARHMARLRIEFQQELAEVDERFREHSPLARTLARGPAAGSIAAIERKYGANLDANSHGEGFLKLFRERFVPGGLYLLDEPEAALSPQSQLGFMTMMRDMIDQDSQFLIATHSPILMAVPGARIYDFDGRPVREVTFEEIEAVNLTRDFLNAPGRFLRHLWS